MFKLKHSVQISKLSTQALFAMMVAKDIYETHTPDDFVITSIVDGQHMVNSKHYEGNAFDFRKAQQFFDWQYTNDDILQKLKLALGRDFDVILEEFHFHVEYDPKGDTQLGAKAPT